MSKPLYRPRIPASCHGTPGTSCIIALLVLLLGSLPARSADKVEFNRDIRPILSENCFFCHGPDKKHRDSGLRLDIRDEALAKEAIVPGKPEESELIDRVTSDDEFERMPPKKSTKRLTTAQKELLKRWIAEGAEYQPHWAYVVPERPAVPTVKARDRVRNPVDAFVLKTLETKKLTPSPEADRRTLLRRLSLDLTGLPPTPAEVAAFLDDADPRAYERQVDRLLDSPHFGERMAVPWLDLARFADTVGYHGDQNQNGSFPIATTSSTPSTPTSPSTSSRSSSLPATCCPTRPPSSSWPRGFNRLNMMTREGGAQPKEYLAKYAADRVRTVATTWLGSTLGCAECHDHKFDPFTTRDFYRLEAFFADVKQWGVYADYGYTPNPGAERLDQRLSVPPRDRGRQPLPAAPGADQAADRAAVGDGRRQGRAPRSQAAWTTRVPRLPEQSPSGWAGSGFRRGRAGSGAARRRRRGSGAGRSPPSPAGSPTAEMVIAQDDGSFLLTGRAAKAGQHRFRLRTRAGLAGGDPARSAPRTHAHGGKVAAGGRRAPWSSSRRPRAGRVGQGDSARHRAGRRRPQGPALFEHGSRDRGPRRAGRRRAGTRTRRRPRCGGSTRPLRLAEGDQVVVTLKSDNIGCVRLSLSPFGTRDPTADRDQPELAGRHSGRRPRTERPSRPHSCQAAYLLGTGSRRGGPGQAAGAPGRVARVPRRPCVHA